jgi:hypothetical protein
MRPFWEIQGASPCTRTGLARLVLVPSPTVPQLFPGCRRNSEGGSSSVLRKRDSFDAQLISRLIQEKQIRVRKLRSRPACDRIRREFNLDVRNGVLHNSNQESQRHVGTATQPLPLYLCRSNARFDVLLMLMPHPNRLSERLSFLPHLNCDLIPKTLA